MGERKGAEQAGIRQSAFYGVRLDFLRVFEQFWVLKNAAFDMVYIFFDCGIFVAHIDYFSFVSFKLIFNLLFSYILFNVLDFIIREKGLINCKKKII